MLRRIVLTKEECDAAGSDDAVLALAKAKGLDPDKPYQKVDAGTRFVVFRQNQE